MRLHRFKDIRSFINEVVESKEEWLARRFKAIAERKKGLGKEIALADIKHEMRLKPNTYRKYAFFIENLLKELNG